MAEKHKGFGNPDVFFGDDQIADSRWVTFTVTTTGKEFIDEITNLTAQRPGSGGLLTLKDSSWVISLSIFEQPEVLEPAARHVCLVGLWALSGEARQFCAEAHG